RKPLLETGALERVGQSELGNRATELTELVIRKLRQRIPEGASGSSCQALDRCRAIRRSERGVKQLPGFGRCRQPRITWPDLEHVAQLGANVLHWGRSAALRFFMPTRVRASAAWNSAERSRAAIAGAFPFRHRS